MHTLYRPDGAQTYFVLAGLEPAYHDAARALEFAPMEDGFARGFPSNSPNLERIYENFARSAADLITQRAGVRPVPWERALETFLRLVEGQGIDWWLVGSAALAVRGLDVTPGDLDLSVDDAGARRLGALLLDYLIEPVVPVADWFCNWFGRSFPGACLEWVGGVDERADTPEISDFGPIAASRRETVTWRGYTLRVPPLAMQREANEQRGRAEHVAIIRRAPSRYWHW